MNIPQSLDAAGGGAEPAGGLPCEIAGLKDRMAELQNLI